MSVVSQDRWTCPRCGRSVVVYGSAADVACCLSAAQTRHGREHRAQKARKAS